LTRLETAGQRRPAITDLIVTLPILTRDDVGSLVFEDRGSTATSGVIVSIGAQNALTQF
jgi:hypothetical protein